MEYTIIALAGFLGFYLKGITGTGVSTVLIAMCSLIIDPKIAVVLASFINIFGGFAMIKIDPVPLKQKYWIPITFFMIIGSVFGAITLKLIDPDAFKFILGLVFLAISISFALKKPQAKQGATTSPEKSAPLDLMVGSIAGFCGGFVGSNAPVLVFHFSRYLNKQLLRRLLVLIFIPAAIAQTLVFIINGMFGFQTLLYAACVFPGMAAGIYLGNKSHHKISELWFRRILSVFLLIVSARLIF